MVNRERIAVSQRIDTLTYELEGNLSDTIAYLQRLQESYPNARLVYEEINGQYDPETRMGMALYKDVEETDAQYNERIAREDGPAMIFRDGRKKYFFVGKEYTLEEWVKLLIL